MILLLGGTSDTALLATMLANAGIAVLVSTATEEALAVGNHANIARRSGRLKRSDLEQLVKQESVEAIVDATHPYATEIRENARAVAVMTKLPYFTFIRPLGIGADEDTIRFVTDHHEAAKLAFSFGRNVLLTTGSNHLTEYVSQADRTGLSLYVRVLNSQESTSRCKRSGIATEQIIAARGPFSVADNIQHVEQCCAGVVVTKDGGKASGIMAKIEAAKLKRSEMVVLRRPLLEGENVYDDIAKLTSCVIEYLRK